jgi:hypothetical protein
MLCWSHFFALRVERLGRLQHNVRHRNREVDSDLHRLHRRQYLWRRILASNHTVCGRCCAGLDCVGGFGLVQHHLRRGHSSTDAQVRRLRGLALRRQHVAVDPV